MEETEMEVVMAEVQPVVSKFLHMKLWLIDIDNTFFKCWH